MRKTASQIALTCLLALIPFLPCSAQQIADDLVEPRALLREQRHSEAETILRGYLASHADSGDACYLLGESLYRQDRPHEALHFFLQAKTLRAANSDELTVVGRTYVRLSRFDDARAAFEGALKLSSSNVEARYQLGRVLYKQSDFEGAISAFESVLTQEPERIGALDNLGLTLERVGSPDRAVEAYDKAIDIDGKAARHSERPYLNKGVLLVKLGKYDDAIPLLNRAVYYKSNCFTAHSYLGQAYLNLQRLEDSQREMELAATLNPGDSSTHYFLGRLYSKLGKQDLAAREFHLTRELTHKDKSRSSSMGMGKEVDMLVE